MVSEFLVFEESLSPSGITKIITIKSKFNTNINISKIKWYPQWRKYCFFPDDNTLFDSNCLTDIQMKIKELMMEGK